MNIIQTKDLQSNNCNVTAWLQNELVVETSYTTELLKRAPRCSLLAITTGFSMAKLGIFPFSIRFRLQEINFIRRLQRQF